MLRHIIHKQTVTISVPELEQSHMLQDTVSRLFSNGMGDGLEQIMNDIAPAGATLRIDKIELDLGTVSLQNFEEEFKSQVLTRFSKTLSQLKAGQRHTSGAKGVTLSEPASNTDALIYFLVYGRLPWYRSVKSLKEWEDEIFDSFSPRDWASLTQWLKENTDQYPYVPERIVHQFSPSFISRLITELTGNELDWRSVVNDIGTLSSFLRPSTPKISTTSLYLIVLTMAITNGTVDIPVEPGAKIKTSVRLHFFRMILSSLIKQNAPFLPLGSNAKKEAWRKKIDPELLLAFDEAVEQESSNMLLTKDERENDDAINQPSVKEEKIETDKKPSTETKKKSKGAPVVSAEDNAIYLSNCGMVLLHPFLDNYFSELGLMSAKKFINDESRKRAALLLHFLATGASEVPEFELLLEKILCGLSTEEPLPAALDLSVREQDESANLLKAVCGHWPPLKNTSIEGLRTSFLQRNGKLLTDESGWQLHVETKAVDVLLGKLPWGYGTVKLPWMQGILHVEWY